MKELPYKQFLAKLRKTPRKWYLNKTGQIRLRHRARHGFHCPLVEVYGEWNCGRIQIAADHQFTSRYYSSEIRRDLLRACGLEEK